MVALSLTILMTMTAFAVDLGRMRTERRDLQANADAIALDAVQMIRGLNGPAAQSAAVNEANHSARRNGLDVVLTDAHVQVGMWDVPTQTFTPTPTDPNTFPDAVQVDLDASVEMFFDFSTDSREVSRRAVAVSRAQTKGELGSVVAGIQPDVYDPTTGCAVGASASIQMTVMNYVYTKLLGITAESRIEGEVDAGVSENHSCQISGPNDGLALDAASYRGLGATDVAFRDLAAFLGTGSPDQMLDMTVTQAEVLDASGRALQSGEDPTTTRYQVGSQLIAIAGELGTSTGFVFGDVFSPVGGSASSGTGGSVADASINALDLLFATATAIDGKNFVGADGGLSVPLPLGTGGALVNVPMKVHVIERPQRDDVWRYAGQSGPSTSQVSIALDVPISVNNLGVDLSYLNILGIGSPNTANATGTLPLVIEVGKATSSYTGITCPAEGNAPLVDMAVTSGAARVRIGTTNDTNFADGVSVNTPSALAVGTSYVTTLGVNALGIGISLQAGVDMAARTTLPYVVGQNFTSEGAGTLAAGTELAAGGGSSSNEFTWMAPDPTPWYRYRGGFDNVSVTDSVVGSFDFGASSSGLLGLLTSEAQSKAARNGMVQSALDPVLQQLDGTVLQPLFNALGLTVGGADARIREVRCQVPALANRDSGTS
jgi:uncharacterized membrane protein